MSHFILPLSTLYYAHPEFSRKRLLPLAQELEIRNFDFGDVPSGKPLNYHANIGLLSEDFNQLKADDNFWHRLAADEVSTLSLDLGPAAPRSMSVFPTTDTFSPEKILQRSCEGVSALRKKFQGTLLLENLPYYRTGLFEHVCRPEFIAHALETMDVMLLLDLAHVEVSARNLGIPLQEYIDGLPLDRVRQIHISKIFSNQFLSVDAHECPDEHEIRLLSQILKRLKGTDVGITVEYYQDPFQLENAYLRLTNLLGSEVQP